MPHVGPSIPSPAIPEPSRCRQVKCTLRSIDLLVLFADARPRPYRHMPLGFDIVTAGARAGDPRASRRGRGTPRAKGNPPRGPADRPLGTFPNDPPTPTILRRCGRARTRNGSRHVRRPYGARRPWHSAQIVVREGVRALVQSAKRARRSLAPVQVRIHAGEGDGVGDDLLSITRGRIRGRSTAPCSRMLRFQLVTTTFRPTALSRSGPMFDDATRAREGGVDRLFCCLPAARGGGTTATTTSIPGSWTLLVRTTTILGQTSTSKIQHLKPVIMGFGIFRLGHPVRIASGRK
jgi:hypothetical protein